MKPGKNKHGVALNTPYTNQRLLIGKYYAGGVTKEVMRQEDLHCCPPDSFPYCSGGGGHQVRARAGRPTRRGGRPGRTGRFSPLSITINPK